MTGLRYDRRFYCINLLEKLGHMHTYLRQPFILLGISTIFIVFAFYAKAQEIPFQQLIIDNNACGHREVADIDRDGLNDIVAVNHDLQDRTSFVWYRYPSWQRNVVVNLDDFKDFHRNRACDMEVADMDNDGDPDILGRIGLNNDVDGVICWFEHPGKESLSCDTRWERHDVGETEYIKDFEVRDFNRDGMPDIAARSNTRVYLYFREGNSWEKKMIPVHHHEGMEAADLDGDGDQDLVLNGFWLENPADPLNQDWPEHQIDGKWYTQHTNNWQDNNGKVTVADMNLDGRPDMILAHSEKPGYPVSWYEAPEDPVNQPWTEHLIGRIDKCHNLKVADFDLDGDPDVLAGTLPNFPHEAPHHFGIFINRGDALQWAWQELTGLGNYSAQVGDIDNDGDMDIAGLRNHNRPPIELWRNLAADRGHKGENESLPVMKISLDKWTYVQVDHMRTRFGGRTGGDGYWFGLAMGDLTGDGYEDIAAGKWMYTNPGGSMEAKWIRNELEDSLDALLITDVDGDIYGDIIAAKCNRQYWIEILDADQGKCCVRQIGSLPVCNHGTSTQGYNLAQVIPGGKPEILLNADGVFCMIIPDNPEMGEWPHFTILEDGSNGEWVSTGDMDGDGDNDVCLFLRNENQQDRDINRVTWLENPGDPSGEWSPHTIGLTNHHGDKVIPADVNLDGRTDLVATEERWPGLDPDAGMYWYEAPEDPAHWNWPRHRIVTQYSMNNLDLADMDRDGDPDIITCEHKGPAEELQAWENDGSGNFSLHVIDRGKESHAGSRLSDLDRDGDLDIVSIAWNDFEYLHVWRNDAILGNGTGHIDGTGHAHPVPLGLELTGDYRYFVPVEITAGRHDFINKVVEVDVDLQKWQNELGGSENIDRGSIRVVEVDDRGDIIDESVVYQFDRAGQSSMKGTLVFMVKGGVPKGRTRHFRILCGPAGGYYVDPVFTKVVRFDDHIPYRGQRSYQIVTPAATYLYHRQGGGFAGLVDPDGNDWISYQEGGGSAGEYRGIPNIRPAGFHPGYEDLRSRVLHAGPLKLTFRTETGEGAWACTWEVYPGYANMTLDRKGEGNYWLLYEGTPAGRLDTDDDYWVRSDGTRMPVKKDWSGVLPDPEWVWFGDEKCNRVLFLAKHEHDDRPDQFWQMQGNMTVFGFGRKPHEEPGTCMDRVPVQMTIGFAESVENETIIQTIQNAVFQPDVAVGKIQKSITRVSAGAGHR